LFELRDGGNIQFNLVDRREGKSGGKWDEGMRVKDGCVGWMGGCEKCGVSRGGEAQQPNQIGVNSMADASQFPAALLRLSSFGFFWRLVGWKQANVPNSIPAWDGAVKTIRC